MFASPVDQGIVRHTPQPGAKAATLRVQMKRSERRNESSEDVLHNVGRVTLNHAAFTDIRRQQRLIDRKELGPGDFVRSIANTLNQ